ncbi:efflux transporter outer membrane subunit [Hydrocarboniphaga sp.]|uniref:efflux transporter outer membrane subunit n=1 Tax=Hydrocarboniphaga sp. TaxID=2033016 RepID=UPI00262CE307|nr:efflux transporter outer membrane subunit [Hydrocarboniphaga sp.]
MLRNLCAAVLAPAALLLAAGCVTVPKTAPAVAAVSPQQLGLSQQRMMSVDKQWWKGFGDSQLDSLIEEAFAHSPSLDEAIARVRRAQAQALAAGAGSQPQLTLDGNEIRQRLSENYTAPPKDLHIGAGGGGVYWIGELGLNLGWDLDFWGRQASLLQAASSQAYAAELDRASARLALAGSIAQAYVDLYRAYALADVAADAQTQRESLLRLAQSRLHAGLDTAVEVKNAEALVPQARLARLMAENQRDVAVHRLAALAGHGADWYDRIQRPQLKLDTALPLPDALPMDLLAHRPDVIAAKARIDAATADRAAAKAAFYPDISLRAFAGFQAVGLDKLLDSNSAAYGVGPAIHLPIFDAHRLEAGYLGATAEIDGTVSQYNDTVLGAVRDVSDALSRGDSLMRQRVESEQSLVAAQAAYDLAKSRYKSGLTSQLTVLNAETQLLGLRAATVGIDANLVIARVTLLLTLGGSFEPPADTAAADNSIPSSPSSAVAGSGASS